MKNENWACWFIGSIIKHFDDKIKDVKLVPDGEDIVKDENRFQLRIDGPIIRELSNNWYNIKFNIVGTLMYHQNDKNVLKYPMLKGHCASAFTRHICCFKYGPGFDQSQFTHLTEVDEAIINDFGRIDDVARVMAAVIEGTYQTQLKGDS